MPRSRAGLPLPLLLLTTAFVAACAGNPDKRTLAELRDVEPDVAEVQIEDGLDQAMRGYRKFLTEAPESALTPEAMRRLADLKLEKQYGILGDGQFVTLEAPATTGPKPGAQAPSPARPRAASIADLSKSSPEPDFVASTPEWRDTPAEDVNGQEVTASGPLEAIELYDKILAAYPSYEHNDRVLYQKARAFDELGRNDEAIVVIERLVSEYPHSRFIDEVQFRRAEYFFTRRKYLDAEEAYAVVTSMGVSSQYYELALYKLGWTLYKQELHEEALDKYIELLDYKVTTGYDFDQTHDEADERRIADTYRVVSLSFSSLGGPDAVTGYFAAKGQRSYESRIYSHLGEFYLEKLRYHDAASAYKAFVALHPLHRDSPHFSMRVVEIYEAGGFPKLVLDSKKEFAATYGLESEYWLHFDLEAAPDVLAYLKSNLGDLANHYHALYQDEERVDEQPANFDEALHWYRAYLASFSQDPETPGFHHQLADLLLEHEDFGEAAREYEHTAYGYDPHEKAAAAGYAAIFAHRQHQKQVPSADEPGVKREAVNSTLRFVDTFPAHEHAAVVLGAAADDLYDMKELELAVATGRKLLDGYPEADPTLRRSAWAAVAHSYFDMADYAQAEPAYARVLEMTPAQDDSHQAVVDSLAAAIYKQGEQASLAEDHRLAADHFLRIAQVAPTSEIRAAAEYDAGAALIRLADWAAAAAVLESFRETHPEHELRREATKQMAFVYREQGDLPRAAGEYERVAAEADDVELRREALLLAGELYEDSDVGDRAVSVYALYVRDFPEPLEDAVETRFKLAALYEAAGDDTSRRAQLKQIVKSDEGAGPARTARIRYLAARSALVLSEAHYDRFDAVQLVQPLERNLQEKQRRMNAALEAFGELLDYEVAEVTAAATFYMAEVYLDFSQALMESERPNDLSDAELQEYELVLEEEAFPFEDRAIGVHEKNLELMATGLYNAWIDKSLVKLAELMPGRYAKFEASSGPIASIDRYAYQAPQWEAPQWEAPNVESTPQPDSDPSPDLDPTAPDAEVNHAETL